MLRVSPFVSWQTEDKQDQHHKKKGQTLWQLLKITWPLLRSSALAAVALTL